MQLNWLVILVRWIHVVSASAVVGSIFFFYLVLPMTLRGHEREARERAMLRAARGAKMTVHVTLLLILLSGAYNAWKNWPIYTAHPGLMHALFGVHLLLGLLAYTFLMVVLAGKGDKPTRYAGGRFALLLFVLGIAAASTLKSAREWAIVEAAKASASKSAATAPTDFPVTRPAPTQPVAEPAAPLQPPLPTPSTIPSAPATTQSDGGTVQTQPTTAATENLGPDGPVFGDSGNAREIVFVCDGSGAMIQRMATMKDELNHTIAALKPSEEFNVIFYGEKIDSFKPAVVPATPENKKAAESFLENSLAIGPIDPAPAIERAIGSRPDLIYFLTSDADIPNTQQVLDAVAKWDPDHRIRINTIIFGLRKPAQDRETESVMKKIAAQTHGVFRWVEMDAIR